MIIPRYANIGRVNKSKMLTCAGVIAFLTFDTYIIIS